MMRTIAGLGVMYGLCMGVVMADAEVPESLVRGVLVEGGLVCPMLRSDEGDLLPLMGVRMGQFPVGAELTLKGVFVARSTCRQGRRTLQVNQVVAVDGKQP